MNADMAVVLGTCGQWNRSAGLVNMLWVQDFNISVLNLTCFVAKDLFN